MEKYNHNALLWAAKTGNVDCITILHKIYGGKIDFTVACRGGDSNYNALMIAAQNGHSNCIKVLHNLYDFDIVDEEKCLKFDNKL